MRIIISAILLCIALHCNSVISLKHHLVLTNDDRYLFTVSHFGYNLGGRLDVIVQNLTIIPDEDDPEPQIGFIIVKSSQAGIVDAARPVQHGLAQPTCLFDDPRNEFGFDLMTLSMLPEKNKVLIRCTGDTKKFPKISPLPIDFRRGIHSSHNSYKHRYQRSVPDGHDGDHDEVHQRLKSTDNSHSREVSSLLNTEFGAAQPSHESVKCRHKRADSTVKDNSSSSGQSAFQPSSSDDLYQRDNTMFKECPGQSSLPLEIFNEGDQVKKYSFSFTMPIDDKSEEAAYYVQFHNCKGDPGPVMNNGMRRKMAYTYFNLSMLIYETNYPENYLPAGAMPLPQMYFMLSVMFFLVGCVWVNFIARQKENTLKIHSLMTVLVFAKTCSLLFHGINYHYIAIDGQPVVTWAYLYYATRAVKGALFFITLALIGTGWTFIKHILSPKDKKIILVIVALQIVAHIAEIVLDESTEGEASNVFWSSLCALVDLFSCIAVLIPITWSVSHLEEASRTDGKAAINLKKMVLFKSFYVISTIYIYVTRIISFVLVTLLVYKYKWLTELFTEMATLIYFMVTGYFFQPMPTNPYLLLSTDNDLDEDILFSVDTHNGGTHQMDDMDEEGRATKVTRRLVEDLV